MPEGPEVSILVHNLNKKVKNKIIKNIKILGGRYTKKKNQQTLIILCKIYRFLPVFCCFFHVFRH